MKSLQESASAFIESVCAGHAEVIDPAEAVARQARRVLQAKGL